MNKNITGVVRLKKDVDVSTISNAYEGIEKDTFIVAKKTSSDPRIVRAIQHFGDIPDFHVIVLSRNDMKTVGVIASDKLEEVDVSKELVPGCKFRLITCSCDNPMCFNKVHVNDMCLRWTYRLVAMKYRSGDRLAKVLCHPENLPSASARWVDFPVHMMVPVELDSGEDAKRKPSLSDVFRASGSSPIRSLLSALSGLSPYSLFSPAGNSTGATAKNGYDVIGDVLAELKSHGFENVKVIKLDSIDQPATRPSVGLPSMTSSLAVVDKKSASEVMGGSGNDVTVNVESGRPDVVSVSVDAGIPSAMATVSGRANDPREVDADELDVDELDGDDGDLTYISVGDVVRLASGGPQMTVLELNVDHRNMVDAKCGFFNGLSMNYLTVPTDALEFIATDKN